jgi:hypothetical protein
MEIINNKTVQASKVEEAVFNCQKKFNGILDEVLSSTNDAHEVEMSIFKSLLELGLLLLTLYFTKFNHGNFGKTVETVDGEAIRGDKSERTYFSLFGKICISRHLYHINGKSLAVLDILLNLPKRRYSYFLSELVSTLTVNRAYGDVVSFLKRYFFIKLSVSAAETIVDDSSNEYEEYYSSIVNIDKMKNVPREDKLTVTSFDGKGVPVIKDEAAKIVGRLGKGEKNQKKKEALVGVKYNISPNIRSAEEVAQNLIYPEAKKSEEKKPEEKKPEEKKVKNKAENKRYIASIEKSKKQVMEEIHESIQEKDYSKKPLICIMDGALFLWKILKEVFGDISNKVLILDIIHVVEYIWKVANQKYKEGSKKSKDYVYNKLKLILEGKVSEYIQELEDEVIKIKGKKKKEIILKVIKYLKNHEEYMKYDEYLACGYPIGTGVIESACGHVVKDRMEIRGARWGIKGGENVLKLRSVLRSDDWDGYWDFLMRKARDDKKAVFVADDYYESLKLAA